MYKNSIFPWSGEVRSLSPWRGRLIARILSSMFTLFCLLLLLGCASSAPPTTHPTGKATVPSNDASQPVTYSTNPHDVVIRTFYGGGIYGALEFSPQVSIYGDGTYILGDGLTMQQGKLNTNALQELLHTLIDTSKLLSFHRYQFYDVQDANATLLELTLNNKSYEFLYGQFGNLQESASDMDEYHRLNQALTTINDALNGPTAAYTGATFALLARVTVSPDFSKTIFDWPLKDMTLADVATYECGLIPQDETSPNTETGCLKYLVPQTALVLTSAQWQKLHTTLSNQLQGVFHERGTYYEVFVRPLLPDEPATKRLAMFGSMELSYKGVPLNNSPIPTPTP
jgi:hypothetical protein